MYGEQIRAWHVENMRRANAEMLAAGTCMVTSAHRGHPVLAEYVWFAKQVWGVGNELPLCARCCAQLRTNAADDLDMMPERIMSL